MNSSALGRALSRAFSGRCDERLGFNSVNSHLSASAPLRRVAPEKAGRLSVSAAQAQQQWDAQPAANDAPDGYRNTVGGNGNGNGSGHPSTDIPKGMAVPGTATARFVRPPGASSPAGPQGSLPFCLYFPAMDGQGLTASAQFGRLSSAFDLHMLQLVPEDRSTFDSLVKLSLSFLEEALKGSPPERPVYLIGDSWGALLALGTALECPAVQRVVLVNPATVMGETTLSNVIQVAAPALALAGPLPEALRSSLSLMITPALGNPLGIARNWLDPAANPLDNLSSLSEVADAVISQARTLAEQLPPATLDWRMKMMRTTIPKLNSKLKNVEQRVLIVAGSEDQLLPSAEEAERLEKVLQRPAVRVIEGAGHSLLQEAGVDLFSIIQDAGYYVTERVFTSTPKTAMVGNNYGKAGPLELPTRKDLDRTFDAQYGSLQSLISPVFFSEDADGTVHQGLEHVFSGTDRPILLIGNHQLMGLDMSFMIREFLVEKNRLMRGLAHPAIFQASKMDSGDGDNSSPMSGMASTFTSFGSVPVGPTNLYRLMQANEMVLLFPGGAREALKRRGEKYQLIWPETAEFVRMAARCGAAIVPFGAIGSEDSLQYIMDSEEVMNNPEVFKGFMGEDVLNALGNASARRGVNAGAVDDNLVPPIVAPAVPSRFYYLFKKPIFLSPEDSNDRDACNETYKTVKREVESSLSYLVKMREVDPYKDLVPRMIYENLSKEQAPTFKP